MSSLGFLTGLGFLTPVMIFAVIILLTWLVARVVSSIVGRAMHERTPLLAVQAKRVCWFVVWAIGTILAIEQLGIQSNILLLVVALLGAGLVVTFRVPLENLGAKYFSDVYVPFKVGDSIKVKDQSGKVIEINSMSTILLTPDNQLVSIPNSNFIHEVVANLTPQAWRELTVPIQISSEIDLAEFESALLKSINKLKLHLDSRFPPMLTTKTRTTQSTEVILTVMIRRPEQRDSIATELNKRIAETINAIQAQGKRQQR
ncbi:MAG: mechanosensitive ion channel domain-containing protein [Nitrososphaerales archaeon]